MFCLSFPPCSYASPDVISGKLYAGPEADIWSAGVILFALLCGTLPFDDESIPYLFRKIKGGLYILPVFLSDSAKDLITKMLVTDSLKRITIAGIRAHPWFQTNLPRYLSVPPQIGQHLSQIDQAILGDVAVKTGFPKEKIYNALRKGRRNHYTVAYHLIKDADDELDTSLMPAGEASSVVPCMHASRGTSNMPSPVSSVIVPLHPSPGAGGGPAPAVYHRRIEGALDPSPASSVQNPNGMMLGSSLSESPAVPPYSQASHHRHLQDATRFVPPRRWNVGIALPSQDPAAVMLTCYRTLHRFNWRWKTPSNHAFQVRVLVNEPGLTRPVRLSLQLFKTSTGFNLDLHLLDGDVFPYLAICGKIFREIQ